MWFRINVVGKVKISVWLLFYKKVIYFIDEEVYFNFCLWFVKLWVVVKVDNLVMDLIEFISWLDKNLGEMFYNGLILVWIFLEYLKWEIVIFFYFLREVFIFCI